MKKIQLSTLITLFALTLFIFSCGSEGHSHDEDATETTQTDENNTENEEVTAVAVDLNSKEYASAFVCPMHCKGSGSDVAGKCPACGMDYVASADLDSDSEEGEGHDDDGHEGHNH